MVGNHGVVLINVDWILCKGKYVGMHVLFVGVELVKRRLLQLQVLDCLYATFNRGCWRFYFALELLLQLIYLISIFCKFFLHLTFGFQLTMLHFFQFLFQFGFFHKAFHSILILLFLPLFSFIVAVFLHKDNFIPAIKYLLNEFFERILVQLLFMSQSAFQFYFVVLQVLNVLV